MGVLAAVSVRRGPGVAEEERGARVAVVWMEGVADSVVARGELVAAGEAVARRRENAGRSYPSATLKWTSATAEGAPASMAETASRSTSAPP